MKAHAIKLKGKAYTGGVLRRVHSGKCAQVTHLSGLKRIGSGHMQSHLHSSKPRLVSTEQHDSPATLSCALELHQGPRAALLLVPALSFFPLHLKAVKGGQDDQAHIGQAWITFNLY